MDTYQECALRLIENLTLAINPIIKPGIVYRIMHLTEPLRWMEYLGYADRDKMSSTAIRNMYTGEIQGGITANTMELAAVAKFMPEPINYLTIATSECNLEIGFCIITDPVVGDTVYASEVEVAFRGQYEGTDIRGEYFSYNYYLGENPEYLKILYIDTSWQSLGKAYATFYERPHTVNSLDNLDALANYAYMVYLDTVGRDISYNRLIELIPLGVAQKLSEYTVTGQDVDLSMLVEDVPIDEEDLGAFATVHEEQELRKHMHYVVDDLSSSETRSDPRRKQLLELSIQVAKSYLQYYQKCIGKELPKYTASYYRWGRMVRRIGYTKPRSPRARRLANILELYVPVDRIPDALRIFYRVPDSIEALSIILQEFAKMSPKRAREAAARLYALLVEEGVVNA